MGWRHTLASFAENGGWQPDPERQWSDLLSRTTVDRVTLKSNVNECSILRIHAGARALDHLHSVDRPTRCTVTPCAQRLPLEAAQRARIAMVMICEVASGRRRRHCSGVPGSSRRCFRSCPGSVAFVDADCPVPSWIVRVKLRQV